MNLLFLLLLPICCFSIDNIEKAPKFTKEISETKQSVHAEGDILYTEEQWNAKMGISSNEQRRSKRAAWVHAKKWTNNTVYYFFHDSITEKKKMTARAAAQQIQSNTCINFVESQTATNRIRIENGKGCRSYLGMIGKEQFITFGDGCLDIGGIAHEFLHALDFEHTMSRSDRDQYVTVDLSVVEEGRKSQYDKVKPSENIIYTPYEYGSVMHYTANAFVKRQGNIAMRPKEGEYLYTMGNKQLTFLDFVMINKHYGCNEHCTAENSPKCKNGGVPHPRDCSKCLCPGGYGGDLCDQRPSGCGSILQATEKWQTETVAMGNKSHPSRRTVFNYCNHWITAPEGMTIEVAVIQQENIECDYGCHYNGFEIKSNKDTTIRNPVRCCPMGIQNMITSSLNPTPIISYNRDGYSSFKLVYRYVDPNRCEDALDYCGEFQCLIMEPEEAKKECPKTCGYCTPTNSTSTESTEYKTEAPTTRMTTKTSTAPTTSYAVCEDLIYCSPFYVENNCSRLTPDVAKKFCPKSCGLCENRCEDVMECDSEVTKNNCSDLSPDLAKKYCAKSCGYCN